MIRKYKITYILENDPQHTKRVIWKFGTCITELEKTFKQYMKEPTVIVEIEVLDDED